MKKNQDIKGLIQGIKALLLKSENRCPLSEDEKVLLENCLAELTQAAKSKFNRLYYVEQATKWLLLFFEVGDKFKNFF